MREDLEVTRKAHHERCDIRRAAQITNTSIEKIQKALDEFGVFETKLYVVSKVLLQDD